MHFSPEIISSCSRYIKYRLYLYILPIYLYTVPYKIFIVPGIYYMRLCISILRTVWCRENSLEVILRTDIWLVNVISVKVHEMSGLSRHSLLIDAVIPLALDSSLWKTSSGHSLLFTLQRSLLKHSQVSRNVGALQVQDRDHLLLYVRFFFSFRGKSLTLLHGHADTENPLSKTHRDPETTKRVILPQNFGEIKAEGKHVLSTSRYKVTECFIYRRYHHNTPYFAPRK